MLSSFFQLHRRHRDLTSFLHDALPICRRGSHLAVQEAGCLRPKGVSVVVSHERVEAAVAAFARGEIIVVTDDDDRENEGDRKSTRLNSSHRCISYAVFCLKKKKERQKN